MLRRWLNTWRCRLKANTPTSPHPPLDLNTAGNSNTSERKHELELEGHHSFCTVSCSVVGLFHYS